MIKTLSLFSGIGGFDLGLEWAGGFEIVGQVEIDPFCNKVLAKHWPDVKRMQNIKEVKGNEFGTVELVVGGVPCQPASCAGKRRGKEDDRWLWDEAFRVIHEAKPTWLIFENVGGLITLEEGLVFDSLLSGLEGQGYEVQPFIIPACAVNAPHRRDRVWIIAHSGQQSTRGTGSGFSNGEQSSEEKKEWTDQGNGFTDKNCPSANAADARIESMRRERKNTAFQNANAANPESGEAQSSEPGGLHAESCSKDTDVADPCHQRLQGEQWPGSHDERPPSHGSVTKRNSAWDEPWIEAATRTCYGGMDDGLPRRMDRTNRLKALGNAVVPQIVEILGRAIMEAEKA